MTHSIASDARVRPYELAEYDREGRLVRRTEYASQEALAAAAWHLSHEIQRNAQRWFVDPDRIVRLVATNARGKSLNVDELVAWRANTWHRDWMRLRYGACKFRCEPVPGTGGWRGGPSSRPSRTQQERRNGVFWLAQDGEPPARAVRRSGYLPDSWDEMPRFTQRSWKRQHKGRKSWDRPVLRAGL